jgi:F-type H+-transporting ATPase subunit delta
MKITKAASRYSKSLLELAVEKDQLEKVLEDINSISALLSESRDLSAFLVSKVVNDDKKEEVMRSLFSGKVTDLTMSFISLLARNKRANILAEVFEDFRERYKIHKRILTVQVTSAAELSDDMRKKIKDAIKAENWNEIVIEETVNPDIIGGFILKTNDLQFDASVSAQLQEIKQSFSNKDYIARL